MTEKTNQITIVKNCRQSSNLVWIGLVGAIGAWPWVVCWNFLLKVIPEAHGLNLLCVNNIV